MWYIITHYYGELIVVLHYLQCNKEPISYQFFAKKSFLYFTEEEFANITSMMSNLNESMTTLMDAIEDMKPAYVHAMKLMNTANQPTADQKNNLVFYGLEPEPLEVQMEKEPEFCRDILETRIKLIFREALKISRDIPFVTVYRFTKANADPDEVIF